MSGQFELFLSQLSETNSTLNSFTDFEKIKRNVNRISIKLNQLNYLIGKENLQEAIEELFSENKPVSKDRIELMNGAKVFFYDAESIKKEFAEYGLLDFSELDEPVKFDNKQPPMKFTMIKCRK